MTKYFGQDVVAQPELVEQIELASKSVIFFFNKFKTKGFKNATMTQPYTDTDKFWDDVLSVSALVNGGTNGLADRQVQYAYYKNLYTTQGIGTAGNTTSAVPANAIRTGSGGVLTDSSGKPVTSGS